MKALFLLVLLVSLAGCATGGSYTFCHPDRLPVEVDQDWRACQYEAEKATGSMKTGFDRGWNKGNISSKCMETKGYGYNSSSGCRNYR